MNAMSRLATPASMTDEARWEALRRRDPAADDLFLYSVATTGVVCRPSCAARPALRRNVAFHSSLTEAIAAGFRPCKRCRPDLPSAAQRNAALIERACRMIETAETPPRLADLAEAHGLSLHHFHRLFRKIVGVTPAAYAAAKRQDRVVVALRGPTSVTASLYDAGFSSSGRFYEQADGMLGMTPTAWRAGGAGETIRHAQAACSLGRVLVAVSPRGICAILLGDDAETLANDLRARFPRAELRADDADLETVLADIVTLVDRPGTNSDHLPLDIRGTAFQRRVWQELRSIPAGQTTSYAEIARRLGQPTASRAVAAACAANTLAVAVPCHRVLASDGRLSGYRWGTERKKALLTQEQEAEAG